MPSYSRSAARPACPPQKYYGKIRNVLVRYSLTVCANTISLWAAHIGYLPNGRVISERWLAAEGVARRPRSGTNDRNHCRPAGKNGGERRSRGDGRCTCMTVRGEARRVASLRRCAARTLLPIEIAALIYRDRLDLVAACSAADRPAGARLFRLEHCQPTAATVEIGLT